MPQFIRIRNVRVLHQFMVRLELSDQTTIIVNLEPFLNGPIFEELRNDPARFREINVDPRAGTIAWPNGADIDPDVLLQNREPAPSSVGPGTSVADTAV